MQSKSTLSAHRVIVWFRNDLRLHDNASLVVALKKVKEVPQTEILPVYCFDPRFYSASVPRYDTLKCGSNRLKFTIEGVKCLRKNLEQIGSQLMVSNEKPEDFLGKLMQKTQSSYTVIYQKEVCPEEQRVEAKVKALNCKVQEVWNSTLMHEDDL